MKQKKASGAKGASAPALVRQLHVVLPEALLSEINKIRFKYHFESRVETIVALLKIGLKHNGELPTRLRN